MMSLEEQSLRLEECICEFTVVVESLLALYPGSLLHGVAESLGTICLLFYTAAV